MKDFQPIEFARLPARRRALRIAELFSPGSDEHPSPPRRTGLAAPIAAEVQPRRRTAM
jgi:hypothetical protein